MPSFYEHISANKMATYFFIFIFLLFIFVLIGIFAYITGLGIFFVPIALVIAILITFGTYYYSDKIVLAISRARPATHEEFTYLDNTVEGLAIAAGIPKPKIYVIDDSAPNAFATGRDPKHAVICVTTGLLQKLNRAELEGVIAHEISHIKNYDIRLMMVVAVMVGIAVLLSDLMLRSVFYGSHRGSDDSRGNALTLIILVAAIILAILTPLIAQLIKLAISRKREFLADASAAELTRYPKGLADALRKIANDKEVLEAANKATAHLYIANPLKGQKLWMKNLFSTHPPIEERIRRLEEM